MASETPRLGQHRPNGQNGQHEDNPRFGAALQWIPFLSTIVQHTPPATLPGRHPQSCRAGNRRPILRVDALTGNLSAKRSYQVSRSPQSRAAGANADDASRERVPGCLCVRCASEKSSMVSNRPSATTPAQLLEAYDAARVPVPGSAAPGAAAGANNVNANANPAHCHRGGRPATATSTPYAVSSSAAVAASRASAKMQAEHAAERTAERIQSWQQMLPERFDPQPLEFAAEFTAIQSRELKVQALSYIPKFQQHMLKASSSLRAS